MPPVQDTRDGLQRALLPLAVLSLLRATPRHGYALVAALREAGFANAQGGTVYPLLRAMEGEGLVAFSWDLTGTGPARKVFEVSEAGARRADRDRLAAQAVLKTIDDVSMGRRTA